MSDIVYIVDPQPETIRPYLSGPQGPKARLDPKGHKAQRVQPGRRGRKAIRATLAFRGQPAHKAQPERPAHRDQKATRAIPERRGRRACRGQPELPDPQGHKARQEPTAP